MEELLGFDSVDSGSSSSEVSQEQVEKQREQSQRAAAGIKKTQKDEKKARKTDNLLVDLFIGLIKDPQYDTLVQRLIPLLQEGTPSYFLFSVASLVHDGISNTIRSMSDKSVAIFEYPEAVQQVEFHDQNLDPKFQNRIKVWFEDVQILLRNDPSEIAQEKLSRLLKTDTIKKMREYIVEVFILFFKQHKVQVTPKQAEKYATHLMQQVLTIVS